MRTLMIVATAVAALALTACTKTDQAETKTDLDAAADKVADKTHEAINSPEVKEVGAEIKEAAGNAVDIAKGAAKGAKDGAQDAAAKVEDKTTTSPDEKK